MSRLIISARIRQKLREKHGIKESDILESFSNRCGVYLKDTREDHQTDPVTRWFIAPNNYGKLLKVVFMLNADQDVVIKTAYEANLDEIRIYQKYAIKNA